MDKNPIINDELLIRFIEKKTSLKENSLVKEWISSSEENQNYFTEFSNFYKANSFQKDYNEINVAKDWKKVAARIASIEENKKVRKLVPSTIWKVVAGLALIISLSLYLYTSNQIITVVANNSTKKVELPDGSLVWLNKNSELSYNKNLSGDTRDVELKGEAYFEVAKNPNKPFTVELNETKTKVLGTQFNLKENINKSVALVLVEGSVSFHTNKEALKVVPGERIKADISGNLTKALNTDLNFMAWKTNRLIFNETPFSKVIYDIEKLHNITFSVQNKALLNCNLTIEFNQESLDNILETLKILYGIEYHLQNDNNYIIEGGGC